MKFSILLLISLSVILNVCAQLGLKAGVGRINIDEMHFSNLISISIQLLKQPVILFAFFCYIFSIFVWLFVLAHSEVSAAYPLVGLGYIINAIAAYYLFGEHLSMLRFGGIMAILLGIFMIVRS